MSLEAMNWAWEQPVAKSTNKLVLLALADHANADGECWPSMKRIAERSDISPRQVSRAINELVELGLVEKASRRRHGGQYRGWDYRVIVQRTPASSGRPLPVTSGHGRPSPADTGVRSEPSENRKEEPLAERPPQSSTKKKDNLFETIADA
ncbi:MAG TPA: helix-turn-helix domain-containing protein, partial [Acidimicrobiia bacterium]